MPAKRKTTTAKKADAKQISVKKAMPATVRSKIAVVKPTGKIFSRRNVVLGLIILLIVIGGLLYVFRGMFIAATVNGQIITRSELTNELDKKAGKATLDNLITKDLILQEMKKKGITVSDAEVNSELTTIQNSLKQQGRTLDDALVQQGLSKQDLIDQIRIQKMIEKLFAKDITVSQKEIDDYIQQNKSSLPAGQDQKTLDANVKQQLQQQKLTAKFQTWLANLQKNSKIQYFVSF